jgi:CelD/BcsL family acetyltransferase involved in cellulose biosynthesis
MLRYPTVSVVVTRNSLSQLASDWQNLFERTNCSHVFLSHEWMVEWWDQWGAGHELFAIEVRDANERLIALAPFYVKIPKNRWAGARVLAFIGSEYVASDHLDILVEPGSEDLAIQEIVRTVLSHRKEWDYIELADCDADSATLAGLRSQLKTAGLREDTTSSAERPYALLAPDFDEFLSTIGASVRYNFRRRLRNFQRAGRVDVICLVENSAIRKHFVDLMRLHWMRFDQLGKVSSFSDNQLLEFHTRLLERMASRPWPRLYLLQLDGQTVAALYGFSVSGRFCFYQSGMDPQWSKMSPGLLMLGCSIEHIIETGHYEFDFLRGTQSYKLHWAKYRRQAVTVRFFDGRPTGLGVLLFLRLRRRAARIRRTIRRIPEGAKDSIDEL